MSNRGGIEQHAACSACGRRVGVATSSGVRKHPSEEWDSGMGIQGTMRAVELSVGRSIGLSVSQLGAHAPSGSVLRVVISRARVGGWDERTMRW